MGFQDWVTKHHESVLNAQIERWPEVISMFEIQQSVPKDTAPELIDGMMQKAVLIMLKARLDADPSLNMRFHPQVKNPVMQQLLTAARVKELAKARIVKKGGAKKLRYDISDLAATFYGKQLIKSAGLDRQKVLDKDELEKLNEACAKVKLVLPETVEPTTTERFFAND
jgi:hypothetical protein